MGNFKKERICAAGSFVDAFELLQFGREGFQQGLETTDFDAVLFAV